MRRLIVAAALLWPSLAHAQGPLPPPGPPAPVSPRIVVVETTAPYRLVRVRVDGDFDSAVFSIEPEELADAEDDADGKGTTFTGPPGRYVIRAFTIKGGRLGKARAVVTIGDPPAPPTPTPTPTPPTPTPVPVPIVGTLHVSLVTDLDSMTPAIAAVREGLAIRPGLKGLDAVYRTYPSTSPELTRLNLASLVTKTGVPCLIVQSSDGKAIYAGLAPADEQGVIAKVKALRGGP